MSPAGATSEPLTRHACEPCRRKKTKCTAERPACSLCRRLNIQCLYLPRGWPHVNSGGRKGVTGAVSKTGTACKGERFQLMESQIHDLYGLLGSSTHGQPRASHDITASPVDPGSVYLGTPTPGSLNAQNHLQSPNESCKFTATRPEPSPEALKHFVDVYRTKIHLQPLPLFRPEHLTVQLVVGPRFLLWSFMSLGLTMSSHDFYEGEESAARDFYARSAEDSVMKLASEGVPTPELTQSLCLIALKHIKTHQLARAWMTIGAASRLNALRILFRDNASSVPRNDLISRAYWSVFLLERLFIPYTPEPLRTEVPDYPDSAPLPPPPSSVSVIGGRQSLRNSETATAGTATKDIGINGHSLRLVSIWGRIRSYLHRLRQGEIEKPWLSESTHTKLSIELIEYEAQLATPHFLGNVALSKRTMTEVSQHREYWGPWMTTQIVWHAAHAILNHPFIHLFVLRSQDGVPHSCLFLQQRVDLALYHTGWLFRLIQRSQDLLEIFDPLVGDIVAATATVLWLFQFARDPKVSQRARDDLSRCDTFLSRIALTWPYISQRLATLRKLQVLAEDTRRETTNQDTTISFKPAWFWDLLDPRICYSTENNSPDRDPGSGSERNPDAKICLKRHFVLPLHEDQDPDQEHQPLDPGLDNMESFFISPEDLEHFDIEALSRDFLQNGFWGQGY